MYKGNLLPVLMTASVDTRGMAGALYAAQDREKMYVETIRYYLSTICRDPRQKIVFCDNSGWDLNSVRGKVGDAGDVIEYLSLDPNDFDITKDKSYNEMILMRQASERSNFIREAGGFFKVTGRYPIYNLGLFVKRASKAIFKDGKVWYCDHKDHPLYKWFGLNWCSKYYEARLYGVTSDFFRESLFPLMLQKNPQDYSRGVYSIELSFLRALETTPKESVVDRFPREPHIGGVAGHQNKAKSWTWSENHDSPLEKAKRFVGNCIRIFIPWLKF
jgi:hypothetical protein